MFTFRATPEAQKQQEQGQACGYWELIPAFGRWVAMLQMLLGRLEIYPVILALSVVTLRIPGARQVDRALRRSVS